MLRATVRGIVARRVRLVLSVAAVALGVGFVTATMVLTDTLDRSYDGLFRAAVAEVDLVVRLRGETGPEGTRERFPDDVADQVDAVPGVARVDQVVWGYAQLVGRDGEAIRPRGGFTLGTAWAQPGQDGPLRLIDGRPPEGPDEVAVDVATARAHGFGVGDRVRVLLQGPAREVTIVGRFGLGDRDDLGAYTMVAFDVDTAQAVLGAPGEVDALNVVVDGGARPVEVRDRVARALGPGYTVLLADDAAADAGRGVRDLLGLLRAVLLGFAAVGVVIAALLVFNTFTIVVAQRTRELGLLRVVGASRSQVAGAILGEALVVGIAASALGVGLGLVAATALLDVVERLGFDVPGAGVVVAGWSLVIAAAVGVTVSVAAAVWPAMRASRRAPLAALSDAPREAKGSRWARALIGAAVLAAGIPVVATGLDRAEGARRATDDLAWVAGGALAMLIGVVVLLGAFAGPAAGFLGRPAARTGIAGRLARENAMRNPRRTAATATALVIGLALVATVTVFGDSTKASVRAAVDRGIRADVILKAQQFAGYSPVVAERAAAVRGVDAVSPLQFRRVRILGTEETVASAVSDGLAATVDLDVAAGRVDRLEPDGILVHEDAARDYSVAVGDTMLVQMSRGTFPLRVAAVYRQADFTGGLPISFVVPRGVYQEGFGPDEQDTLVYLRTAGDADEVATRVRRALHADFPNVDVLTRAQYRDDQERIIDRFLAIAVALLALSVIIAVLGIVNTLALSVYERTREIGLLRVVGMTTEQVRRMIRGEAVVIAALGTVVGLVVGLGWGWLFTRALRGQGLTTWSVPWLQLLGFGALAVLAGIAAAWLPARRASRLDVLAAIAQE